MRLVKFIAFLRKHLKGLTRLSLAVLVFLVLLDACPEMVDKQHAHTQAEHIPGFWSIFGFLACISLVQIALSIGQSILTTREDYYDK